MFVHLRLTVISESLAVSPGVLSPPSQEPPTDTMYTMYGGQDDLVYNYITRLTLVRLFMVDLSMGDLKK